MLCNPQIAFLSQQVFAQSFKSALGPELSAVGRSFLRVHASKLRFLLRPPPSIRLQPFLVARFLLDLRLSDVLGRSY